MIIRFGPKYSLTIDPSLLKLRPGWQAGLFDLADLFSKLVLPLFLLLIYSFDLYSTATGQVVVIALYALVITALSLQIVRRILGRNENLPEVPYDLILLSLTTLVAVSLFYHTAVARDQTNLWGGVALKSISGISMIAYWFLYYLLLNNSASKKNLGNLIKMIFWAPLLMVVLVLAGFKDVPASVVLALSCLIPGLTILILTQKKNRLLLILDLIVSLVILFTSGNKVGIFSMLVTFIVSFILIVIWGRNKLFTTIKALDEIKFSELRRDLWGVLNRHALFVFLAISLGVSLFSLFWFNRNLSQEFFAGITLGLKSQDLGSLAKVLVGNGMKDSAGSKLFQFIYSYGFVSFAMLLVIVFQFCKNGIRLFQSKVSLQIKGLLLFLASAMFAIFIILLLQNTSLELILVLLVIFAAFHAQLKLLYLDKKEVTLSRDLNLLTGIKADNSRFFLRLLQFSLAIAVILAGIYLLSFLKYINIFIVQ